MIVLVRRALTSDIGAIFAVDQRTQTDPQREDLVIRSVAEGNCFIVNARTGNTIAGYGVLEYSFYSYGFIGLVYVDAQYRRQNYATALIDQMESICRTGKIFSSTNLSNIPMQSLFAKLEYQLAGVIHGLDEGDPELVYYKELDQKTA